MTGVGDILVSILVGLAEPAQGLELTAARIVAPSKLTGPERKAVAMLQEEVEKRTGVRWPIDENWPEKADAPVIAVGPHRLLSEIAGPRLSSFPAGDRNKSLPPEGFQIKTATDSPACVLIVGNDERGVLFGVGKLLRSLEMRERSVKLARPLDVASAPRIPIRGHQLGYRPKTNSYDAWDLPQWEQYYRDLAVFGTNAVELIPPKSDDDDLSPHFPRPKMEMMVGMSKLAADYGLDVWAWYPALDGDYGDEKVVEFALKEWGEVLGKLPRIDAVFVPTGDPGKTRPRALMPMLERQAARLRSLHPRATWWISLQGFTQEWWDEMMPILAKEPSWLTGICYGPQTRVTLAELKKVLPSRYRIRLYPDITHCIWCQYPVPDWDLAFAQTEHREPINPRPVDQRLIFKATIPGVDGFITYSEGCNDDVNKIVWSGLGWDPDAAPADILADYGRYFIGTDEGATFAQGLIGLEKNWRGPVRENTSIEPTLALFQSLERNASPALKKNWRYQQALYRAYYDAFVKARSENETALEKEATTILADAKTLGANVALSRAQEVLAKAKSAPAAPELRARVFELAEDLFQSIRMQLSVSKYKAIEQWRGANLDSIDAPLNNAPWLLLQFGRIRQMPSETERLAAIEGILRWADPGPGGFYDDLGDPLHQPHLVRGASFADDPGNLTKAYVGFDEKPGFRRSWLTYVDALFGTPIVLKYDGLDPKARYRLRVVYGGGNFRSKIRLVAGDGAEVHPWMVKPAPVKPIEFAIPPSSTASGALTLSWTADPNRGGNGRGCEILEVWLLKEKD